MDVLLVTDDAGFTSALPALESFARVVGRAPLTCDSAAGCRPRADVAIIDARLHLPAARNACRRLTATARTMAVVIVAAEADLMTVDGDWNFDDVVLATSSAAELCGRLRLAVSRRRDPSNGALEFGDLVLRPASYTASLRGRKINFTLTEFKLLNYLVQHADHALTRSRLMEEACGQEYKRRTVDVHVQRLRAKLGEDYESMVETVRGVGYMAVSPQRRNSTLSGPVLSAVQAS